MSRPLDDDEPAVMPIGSVRNAARALDASPDPARHAELAAALDGVMLAAADLRIFVPQPPPANPVRNMSPRWMRSGSSAGGGSNLRQT
jgi:hypothetical protein